MPAALGNNICILMPVLQDRRVPALIDSDQNATLAMRMRSMMPPCRACAKISDAPLCMSGGDHPRNSSMGPYGSTSSSPPSSSSPLPTSSSM